MYTDHSTHGQGTYRIQSADKKAHESNMPSFLHTRSHKGTKYTYLFLFHLIRRANTFNILKWHREEKDEYFTSIATI